MKKCKCCGHEMLDNGDSDFCQGCFAFLSVPANLVEWLQSAVQHRVQPDGYNAVSQNGIYSDNPNDDEGDK